MNNELNAPKQEFIPTSGATILALLLPFVFALGIGACFLFQDLFTLTHKPQKEKVEVQTINNPFDNKLSILEMRDSTTLTVPIVSGRILYHTLSGKVELGMLTFYINKTKYTLNIKENNATLDQTWEIISSGGRVRFSSAKQPYTLRIVEKSELDERGVKLDKK